MRNKQTWEQKKCFNGLSVGIDQSESGMNEWMNERIKEWKKEGKKERKTNDGRMCVESE